MENTSGLIEYFISPNLVVSPINLSLSAALTTVMSLAPVSVFSGIRSDEVGHFVK